MRRTFNVRFSEAELAQLRMKAKVRGWSVGKYIRFRVLDEELEQEQRIKVLEAKLSELWRVRE